MSESHRAPLIVLIVGLITVVAGFAEAQDTNTRLLSRLDTHGAYNDVWGYRAPDGREYAILGTDLGTAFIETTDPQSSVERAFISGPKSTWRDMKTLDHYVYVVTEGGAGVQIIDLQNPDQPVLLKTWGTSVVGHSHNIAIDTGARVLYAAGTPAGLQIISLADPINPQHIATYGNAYVHDLQVQNGLAHLALIHAGQYRILDVSNLPSFFERGSTYTPGRFTHNAWANFDDTLCATTDESGGGGVGLYDISNPDQITLAGFFRRLTGTVHNAHFLGDRVYLSYYSEGLVVIDVSDPSQPREIAAYDTHHTPPGQPTPGTRGAWGCYPYQPSGTIYISDMDNGLFVVQIVGIRLDPDPIPHSENLGGSYPVRVRVTSDEGRTITAARVHYSFDEGASWHTEQLTPGVQADEWEGELPGPNRPTTVQYYFEAEDDSGASAPAAGAERPSVFDVGRREILTASGFEGPGDEGWTHGASLGQDEWQRGAPSGEFGDPDAALAGSSIWGTDLGLPGDARYENDSVSYLDSPVIDASSASGVRLRYWRWLASQEGTRDAARLLVGGQVVWQNDAVVAHSDEAWTLQDLDVSALADGDPSLQVRFDLSSDASGRRGGWNIDELELFHLKAGGPTSLTADAFELSASSGGTITFDVDAGAGHAGENYLLAASRFGCCPGTPLNQKVTLAVNFDPILTPLLLDSSVFPGSSGVLDAQGAVSIPHSVPAGALNPLVGAELTFGAAVFTAGVGPVDASGHVTVRVSP